MKQETLQLHDITPIPSFQFEPGFWEWTLLVVAVALGLLSIPAYKLFKRWTTPKLERGLVKELASIEPLLNNAPRDAAVRLSNVGRRFLEIVEPTRNFTAMSAAELSESLKNCSSNYMRTVIEVLITLENGKFNPNAAIDVRGLYKELYENTLELARSMAKNQKR